MSEKSLNDKLAEYDALSSSSADIPEAGATHYLKRGALQGISALADLVPNLYNLGKAAVGVTTGLGTSGRGAVPASDLPNVGEANPIANFLMTEYGVNEPARPSAAIGGKLGAAVLEGAGGAASQGPMGFVRAGPAAVVKELAKQEARNAVIGGAAGGGGELGGEVGGTPGAVIGSLAAGVAVPSSFIRKGGVTVGGARAALDAINEIKAKGGGKIEPAFSDYVQGTVRGAAAGTPNAAENITEGLRLRATMPGFEPSVAEMSGSPGLLDMQRKFALLNPRNLNAEVARTEANAAAVQDAYRTAVPAAESPGSVRSSVNQSLAEYEKLLEDQSRGVAGKLPVSDQLAAGGKLADIAQAEKTAARPPITAAYQKAFDAAGDATVPAEGIVTRVEQILGEPISQIKPGNAPQTVSALRRIYGDKTQTLEGRSIPPDLMALEEVGGKKNLTLSDLHDIRVAIGQDVASASRSMDPTAARRLRNLGMVMPEVDAAIKQLPNEAQAAYSAATAKYRDEYAPRFKEGANLRVFTDTSLNEPRILPDKMVSEYFKTDAQGGGTRAMQFYRLFGQNQEAKNVTRDGILDLYRQKVVNPTSGAIEPAAHDAFMRDYGRTLTSYKAAGVNALDDIKQFGQQATKAADAITDFKSLSKTLKFDTVDELANDALRNPKTMGNVLTRMGTERRGTFNTILLDKAFESGTASGMRQFLDANRKTLSMTVPPAQLNAMNDIAKALEMTERAPIRGNIAAGGADMLKNATGTSTATVFSQIRAVTGGRSSVEWAAINLAMPALNKMTQTTFANVMENALHNPNSAVALRNYLLAETPTQANAWAGRLLQTMRSAGNLIAAAKGPIISNMLGPQRYPENLARTGTAIRSQLQQEQAPQ